MIVNMSEGATEEQIKHIIDRIREAGYQPHVTRGTERTIVAAVGSGRRHEIEALQVAPDLPERGPIGLIIADQNSVTEKVMVALHERHPEASIVLLARATIDPLRGDWSRVLRRPFSVADVVSAAEALLPMAVSLRRPLDEARPDAPL